MIWIINTDCSCLILLFLKKLNNEVKALKESMESVTKASVEAVVRRILAYTARPLTEFNKYEALEMLETLQNTASDKHHEKSNYYRLAHQTARSNIDVSKLQFHSLVARLIGDKDQEKVLDIESKVAKTYRQQATPRRDNNYSTPYRRPQWQRNNRVDLSQVKCFACGEPGHYRANCLNKKSMDKDKDTRARKN